MATAVCFLAACTAPVSSVAPGRALRPPMGGAPQIVEGNLAQPCESVPSPKGGRSWTLDWGSGVTPREKCP